MGPSQPPQVRFGATGAGRPWDQRVARPGPVLCRAVTALRRLQATSWGGCLGGEWPAGRILIDRRRGEDRPRPGGWEHGRHIQ